MHPVTATQLSPLPHTRTHPTRSLQGYLFPAYFVNYWMGLKVDSRPRFKSLDPSLILNETAYTHWGVYLPGGLPEPNNLRPQEECTVGNFSQAWDDGMAGWADTRCEGNYTFICKILREW